VQTQRYFPTDISRIRLPRFDESNPSLVQIAELSKSLHDSATSDVPLVDTQRLEETLSHVVSTLWNFSEKELRSVQDYYQEILHFRRAAAVVSIETEPNDE
jgi:hypothetical protein